MINLAFSEEKEVFFSKAGESGAVKQFDSSKKAIGVAITMITAFGLFVAAHFLGGGPVAYTLTGIGGGLFLLSLATGAWIFKTMKKVAREIKEFHGKRLEADLNDSIYQKLNEKENEIKSLQEKLQNALNAYESKNRSQQAKNEMIQKELQFANNKLKTTQDKLQTVKDNIESENQRLQNDHEIQIGALQTQIADLQSQLDALKEQNQLDNSRHEKQVKEKKATIANLKSENIINNKNIESLQKKLGKNNQKLIDITEELEELRTFKREHEAVFSSGYDSESRSATSDEDFPPAVLSDQETSSDSESDGKSEKVDIAFGNVENALKAWEDLFANTSATFSGKVTQFRLFSRTTAK